MRILVVLSILLMAVPAQAEVWLLIVATQRQALPGATTVCMEDAVNPADSYTDQSSCEGAGFTWIDETYAGQHGRGDIIGVYPGSRANTQFGKNVCYNRPPASGGSLICVKITDKDPADAKQYLVGYLGATGAQIEEARFYVNWAAIPSGVQDFMWNNGWYQNDWLTLKPFIYDKSTGAQVP